MDRSSNPMLQGLQRQITEAIKAPVSTTEQLAERVLVCEWHGSYQSSGARYFRKHEVWSKCPDCEEVKLAADRQRNAQERAEAELARIEVMLQQAAIPVRFKGRSLDNFNVANEAQRLALSIVRDYADRFEVHANAGHSLVLSGLPGTGKSHLAIAVLQAIMPTHCGLYVTCMGLIRAVRNTWSKDSEHSESQVLHMFGTVPLLVIDEVGMQNGTDNEQGLLFDVLDQRYRDMRPTILLTNADKRGLRAFVGDRVFDRLTETARWVPFDWPSYRPTARKQTDVDRDDTSSPSNDPQFKRGATGA